MTDIAIYIDISPDFTTEAVALLKKYRAAAAMEEGNAGILALQETSRQNRFVIIETWNGENEFRAHEAAPHTAEFRSAIRAIHNSPYDQRVHHTFASGGRQGRQDEGRLYVVTHVDVPPPRKDETEVLLTVEAAKSRTDDGNVRYDVFQQNAPRTNHFTVLAVWKDQSGFVSHQATPHTRQFREALGPMLGAPYDERLYELLT
jgi:quinol monooxygenase YgiN